VENWRHVWPVETICRVMRVSPHGYRSWRTRPIGKTLMQEHLVMAMAGWDSDTSAPPRKIEELVRIAAGRLIRPSGEMLNWITISASQSARVNPMVTVTVGNRDFCEKRSQ